MLEILQDIVFGLGWLTALLEIGIGLYFWRLRTYFGPALACMCFADASASIATTIFSLSTILGLYGGLSPEFVVFLRMMIFIPLFGSSCYLLWKVLRA